MPASQRWQRASNATSRATTVNGLIKAWPIVRQRRSIGNSTDGVPTIHLERFRDHAARIMRNYGFNIVAMWEAKTERRTEFVYLLAWPDETAKSAAWAEFMADEEWTEIKQVTSAEHGKLVGMIEDRVLVPTRYSPSMFHSS
jgi:CBS domain-containing protein